MSPFLAFLTARYGGSFASRDEIQRHHDRALDRIRRKVLPQSPFYRDDASRPFSDWPIMDKAGLQARFTEINTRNLPREKALELIASAEPGHAPLLGDLAIEVSPGTEGLRGLMLGDRRERARRRAGVLGRYLPSPLLGPQRLAQFVAPGSLRAIAGSRPLLRVRHYDPASDLATHLPDLQRQQPSLLIAPARILSRLAQAQRAGDLAIAPRRIVSTSEVLTPEDATEIFEAFQLWPDQIYDCVEGQIAQSCTEGHLHLNERDFIIERDEIPGGNGAFRPIITSLDRETLPLLRYRLDDVLIPDPTPCPCGCASQRLARIEGRAVDLLYWRRIDGGRSLIEADLIHAEMNRVSVPILDYRIWLRGDGRMEIALDSPSAPRAACQIEANLDMLARRLDCHLPQLLIRERIEETAAPRRRIRNDMAEGASDALRPISNLGPAADPDRSPVPLETAELHEIMLRYPERIQRYQSRG